ncbi:elongator complex protein 2 [Telopea speciosissima]|uniref:elongator complex protein 2 n=1 Tax=Telopea speciosissima TaxID=54955 RepID=UPI001CC51C0F|nr:elongator complex protein 2 [Telopea speciosissima]
MSSSSSSIEVERAFIGAGCNRVVNNVSWGPCGLVAFGAQNAVAIFCPKTAQILTTLPGHKALVNCTQWLPSCKDAFKVQQLEKHFLLSGDTDGVIIVWELSLKDGKWRYVSQVPQSHKKGITCITGIMVSGAVSIFASTSSDCTVCVWEMTFSPAVGGECKLSCLETLSVGSKAIVAVSLAELPGTSTGHLVLAMGGLDNKVHLYCGERTGKFIHACELKGHSDWIRSLDFSLPICTGIEMDSLLLVSSSQDRSIRIWKMALHSSPDNTKVPYRKEEIGLTSYIEGPVLIAGSSSYQISLESLLVGHEDWVYSVEWHPPSFSSDGGTDFYQPLSILSASMDKTMMVWQPEKTTGIWVNVVTVGELSHCALGFYGGHWSPSGDSILAHGYGGSFHLWKNIGVNFDDWQPQKVPSGHFAAVMDAAWARSGEYLLSVSHDQTTRIFTPWKNEVCLRDGHYWHEIARPQVHGHDINCVAVIRGKGNHRFVSGAEEKVARVFEAPLSFLKTLAHATAEKFSFPEDLQEEIQILGANMSALGLSQKPIYSHSANDAPNGNGNVLDTLETIPDAVPIVLTEPPIEDQLSWHTLWPETHKLYGHGNELFSLCCDHGGRLIASSCKAQSATVAEIWLWQVGSWKAVGRLQSHSLTVTQMEFCHDDSLLLAISRDRQFSVFRLTRTGVDEVSYELIAKQEAHKRIIWACSWNPFGHEFATGSRDKTVKIWSVESGSSVKQLMTLPQFSSSVTALSWVGCDATRNQGILAVGMESGLIELWSLNGRADGDGMALPGFNAALAVKLDPFICHVSTVHRLAWRNSEKSAECSTIQLASCGADHCVRVFDIKVDLINCIS